MKHINRRAFLQAGGAAMALPMLESFSTSGRASGVQSISSPDGIPKRLIFLAMGYGITGETWYPDTQKEGSDYTLPDSLAPLESHKADMSIIQNLYHRHSRDGHWGTTFWLTGANRYGVPGRKFHNTVSVDQVAAEKFGMHTRFTSIRLNGATRDDGHGPGSSASWNRSGKSLSAHRSLSSLYHELFSAADLPVEQRIASLNKHKSVLDTVLEDARSLSNGLTRVDSEKLGEYFESIRQIETRIQKEAQWVNVPKKRPDSLQTPGRNISGMEAVETAFDLMIAAMQVDASRVFTYMLPIKTLLPEITDVSIAPHSISHYGSPKSMRGEISTLRDQANARLLAGFIDRLKATKEVDGSSLFDHTTIVYGGNISVTHNLKNCPTLIAGRGAGIKLGEHFVMDNRTPLCDLWLSILNGIGLPTDSFGDSNGMLDRIMV
ncbi:MAG: DUF1552 domain-containing protein [Opitutales bacterium]